MKCTGAQDGVVFSKDIIYAYDVTAINLIQENEKIMALEEF